MDLSRTSRQRHNNSYIYIIARAGCLQGVQVGGGGEVAGGAHGQLGGGELLGGGLNVPHRDPVDELRHLTCLHHVSGKKNLQEGAKSLTETKPK
jgi:hypothetical protein